MTDPSAGITLYVCQNRRSPTASLPSCGPGGGFDLLPALEATVARRGLPARVVAVPCQGRCALGPNLRTAPGNRWIHGARADQAEAILDTLFPGQA